MPRPSSSEFISSVLCGRDDKRRASDAVPSCAGGCFCGAFVGLCLFVGSSLPKNNCSKAIAEALRRLLCNSFPPRALARPTSLPSRRTPFPYTIARAP